MSQPPSANQSGRVMVVSGDRVRTLIPRRPVQQPAAVKRTSGYGGMDMNAQAVQQQPMQQAPAIMLPEEPVSYTYEVAEAPQTIEISYVEVTPAPQPERRTSVGPTGVKKIKAYLVNEGSDTPARVVRLQQVTFANQDELFNAVASALGLGTLLGTRIEMQTAAGTPVDEKLSFDEKMVEITAVRVTMIAIGVTPAPGTAAATSNIVQQAGGLLVAQAAHERRLSNVGGGRKVKAYLLQEGSDVNVRVVRVAQSSFDTPEELHAAAALALQLPSLAGYRVELQTQSGNPVKTDIAFAIAQEDVIGVRVFVPAGEPIPGGGSPGGGASGPSLDIPQAPPRNDSITPPPGAGSSGHSRSESPTSSTSSSMRMPSATPEKATPDSATTTTTTTTTTDMTGGPPRPAAPAEKDDGDSTDSDDEVSNTIFASMTGGALAASFRAAASQAKARPAIPTSFRTEMRVEVANSAKDDTPSDVMPGKQATRNNNDNANTSTPTTPYTPHTPMTPMTPATPATPGMAMNLPAVSTTPEGDALATADDMAAYEPLLTLLTDKDLKLVYTLADASICAGNEQDTLARAIVSIFRRRDDVLRVIEALIVREVDRSQSSATLFRTNSLATKVMGFFIRAIGKDFLKVSIQQLIAFISVDFGSCEIDPTRLGPDESAQTNAQNLAEACGALLDRMPGYVEELVPKDIHRMCSLLKKNVEAKYPTFLHQAIGGFFFLRYVCPAIVSPQVFGVVAEAPRKDIARNLTMISKVVQNLANGVNSTVKDPSLGIMSLFHEEYMPKITALYSMLTAALAPPSAADIAAHHAAPVVHKDLRDLFEIVALHEEAIVAKMEDDAASVALVLVGESLDARNATEKQQTDKLLAARKQRMVGPGGAGAAAAPGGGAGAAAAPVVNANVPPPSLATANPAVAAVAAQGESPETLEALRQYLLGRLEHEWNSQIRAVPQNRTKRAGSTAGLMPNRAPTRKDLDLAEKIRRHPDKYAIKLLESINKGQMDKITQMLDCGVDVNISTPDGWRPLHMAAFAGRIDVIMDLIERGALLDGTTETGETPLHIAAAQNHLSAAKTLIARGASVTIRTRARASARDLARDKKNTQVAEFLGQRMKVYARDLTNLTEATNWRIPRVVEMLQRYLIKKKVIAMEGVFRVQGPSSMFAVNEARDAFDDGFVGPNLDGAFADEFVPSECLRLYYKELPEGLLPTGLYEIIVLLPTAAPRNEWVHRLQPMILEATETYLRVFENLLVFLRLCTTHSEASKMTSASLAAQFGPCVIRPPAGMEPNVAAVTEVFGFFIDNFQFFKFRRPTPA